MVLVYGAAGLLGQVICRRLRQEGKRVRALFAGRASAASLEPLNQLGVETFFADLRECAAVAAACNGVDAVICADSAMMPCRNEPPLDAARIRCLVEFASAVGVGRFVFITVPDRFATPCALVSARDEGRARLEAHSMDYVLLQPGLFMETWLTPEFGFDYKAGKATVFGEGTQPVAWVSCEDVADLAVRSLQIDHRSDHRFHVAAPENLSPFDLIRVFEDIRGERMEVTRIAEPELRAEHRAAADPGDRVIAAMKLQYAYGLPLRANHHDIPVMPSSVRDFAWRAMAAPRLVNRASASTFVESD
jgi:uncharacterized protein YbjT (DUF2867 family)